MRSRSRTTSNSGLDARSRPAVTALLPAAIETLRASGRTAAVAEANLVDDEIKAAYKLVGTRPDRPDGDDVFAWVAAESGAVRSIRADLRIEDMA